MKNGIDLKRSDPILKIESVKKDDRGMYQCFVRNDQESAQATAELRLGGRFDPPEFINTFTERIVTPGLFVSLTCVAKGDPSPTFEWFVYGKKIDGEKASGAAPRRIGTYTSLNGDVTTHLNITTARTKVKRIIDLRLDFSNCMILKQAVV